MIEEYFNITDDDLRTIPFDPADYLNSKNKMQEFLNIAIRKRKRNKKGLCEAFKIVVRASCLNNPKKKDYFIKESEHLLQEGTHEALRKVADLLGLKVPKSFLKMRKNKNFY